MSESKNDTGIFESDSEGGIASITIDEVKERYPELEAVFDDIASSATRDLLVCLVGTSQLPAVFRTANGPEYEQFTGAILSDKEDRKVKAMKAMAIKCVVHPDRKTFEKWLGRWPSIPATVHKPLNKVMGGELGERGKE